MSTMTHHKCQCTVCGGHIEYPESASGEVIACPHCADSVQLPAPDAEVANSTSVATIEPLPSIAERPVSIPEVLPSIAKRLPIYRLYASDFICESCGMAGRGIGRVPGSLAVEILLWLIFFVPGLLYSLWRISSRGVCIHCGGRPIPVTTPRGRELVDRYCPGSLIINRHEWTAERVLMVILVSLLVIFGIVVLAASGPKK